ncbi:hypothetical protein BJ742DRAFT_831847 [Cladochytrium replicatum]|nr:hypothetical protein BJ742DRAFT_831847 [Cladochytrium replicatum]
MALQLLFIALAVGASAQQLAILEGYLDAGCKTPSNWTVVVQYRADETCTLKPCAAATAFQSQVGYAAYTAQICLPGTIDKYGPSYPAIVETHFSGATCSESTVDYKAYFGLNSCPDKSSPNFASFVQNQCNNGVPSSSYCGGAIPNGLSDVSAKTGCEPSSQAGTSYTDKCYAPKSAGAKVLGSVSVMTVAMGLILSVIVFS